MTQGPYHLISIGLLFTLSYFVSLLMVRIQLLTLTRHRKFWNSLLLLFFLSAAVLGLLLAINVNYKLDLKWTENAIQWHVDLGIGFASVSIFHLSWHLGYFKKMVTGHLGDKKPAGISAHLKFSSLQVRLLFLLLGFISLIAQLVLLREFMKTLHGNELVIAIYLALWMILTSAGAWAGSGYKARISGGSLIRLLLGMSVYPLVIYIILILITRLIFLPGFEPGIIASVAYIVLLIGPLTLVSGFLFAYLSRASRHRTGDAAFYMLDSLGSLAGGLLFGLFLVFVFDNIQVLSGLLLGTLLALQLIFGPPGRLRIRILLLTGAVLLFAAVQFPGVRNRLEGVRYRGETILDTRDTPYGNLTFAEKDGQVTGYLDRNPVLTPSDLASAEETVHYPALQHDDPSSFLLMGGGFSGNIAEVLKYSPDKFDYCEADPDIFRMGSRYLPELTDQVNFIPEDGRSWLLKAGEEKYDVIISAAGDPFTIGWNRYFTKEFYELVSTHLTPGGIFSMQLSSGGNYVDEKGGISLSINYNTLTQVFDNVIIVPGFSTYFLASSDAMSLDFPALLEEHPVQTTYVHPDYLDLVRLTFDSDQLMERIGNKPSGINIDLWPRLFFSSLSSLESRMGSHSLLATGIISLAVFLVLLLAYKPLKAGMFVTGFTGAGIQILLILVMQSLYGYAYRVTPVMITIFMAGIVAGAKWWSDIWRQASLSKYTVLLWIMAITAAMGVVLLKTDQLFDRPLTGQLVLGLLNFIPGMIVGSVYGMSLALSGDQETGGIGMLYSADLAGAALGTFIPALIILPLIGVTNTFILFCGINVATGLYILTRWR